MGRKNAGTGDMENLRVGLESAHRIGLSSISTGVTLTGDGDLKLAMFLLLIGEPVEIWKNRG